MISARTKGRATRPSDSELSSNLSSYGVSLDRQFRKPFCRKFWKVLSLHLRFTEKYPKLYRGSLQVLGRVARPLDCGSQIALRVELRNLDVLAGGPAFKLQKPPQLRVPRPSRTLRRAGTTTAYTTGSVERTKVTPAASPPTLARTQGWGTLRGNGAMQRWDTRPCTSR